VAVVHLACAAQLGAQREETHLGQGLSKTSHVQLVDVGAVSALRLNLSLCSSEPNLTEVEIKKVTLFSEIDARGYSAFSDYLIKHYFSDKHIKMWRSHDPHGFIAAVNMALERNNRTIKEKFLRKRQVELHFTNTHMHILTARTTASINALRCYSKHPHTSIECTSIL
jgi:hypothetical protein